MAQFYLKFLLITQHEVPFINTSEATKKVEWPNRERQNITNRRSRVGESTPFHTCISGQSRQREGRELFRYCYFYFIVMNHRRRCFGPNHTSLMQIKRNSVTALLSACNIEATCSVSICKLNMYLLLVFRLYFVQSVEQPASPTTKKMKPE